MSRLDGTYVWDSDAGATAYIYTGVEFERPAARTVEVSEGVNIDLDRQGRVVGIELLSPYIELVDELRVMR